MRSIFWAPTAYQACGRTHMTKIWGPFTVIVETEKHTGLKLKTQEYDKDSILCWCVLNSYQMNRPMILFSGHSLIVGLAYYNSSCLQKCPFPSPGLRFTMCTWESWTEWCVRVLLVIACCEITSLLWGFLHLGPSEEFAVLISSKWLGIRWLFLFWLWVEEKCFAFFFFFF